MLTYRRIQVSQRQLRRALVRALRIMEKHKGAHPALSGLEAELVASAKNFRALYDAREQSRRRKKREVSEGHGKIEELSVAVATWAAVLSKDRPEAAAGFTKEHAPDAVIATAQSFRSVMAGFAEGGPDPLPYAEEALAHIDGTLAEAEAEWSAARAAIVDDQDQGQALRDAAVQLHAALIALRRTLRVVLGPTHLDYHALRTTRTTHDAGDDTDEVDDDEVDDDDDVEIEEPVDEADAPPETAVAPTTVEGDGSAATEASDAMLDATDDDTSSGIVDGPVSATG